jgi:predicted nucleic acid-binding Zn ribbon protein
MRATERQRGSGQQLRRQYVAWPGNAIIVWTLSTGRAGIVLNPMPTYVYRFVKTGETIEVQQSFTDAPLTAAVHPRSGRKMAVKKVFTPVGVTFRGGGFYKTDSRAKSSKAKPSKTEGTAADTSSATKKDASSTSASSTSDGSAGAPKKSDAKATATP